MNKIIKTGLLVTSLLFSGIAIAKEETFIRDYQYQASETDSKVSARNTSLLLLKEKLLGEIGTYVDSSINIFNSSSGLNVSSQQVQSLTEGLIKAEILSESWNGVTFVIKAKLTADPDEIVAKLKSIAQANKPKSNSSEEFEYWKSTVQINSADGYLAYMNKYPQGKYNELAQIAIARIKSDLEKNDASMKWLVKRNGNVALVVRHDVGADSDLDGDDITEQMGSTATTILKNYLPDSSEIKVFTDFDFSEEFRFNHKEQSIKTCQKNKVNLVSGLMLEDHDGTGGMQRPVRMFFYDCEKNHFKLSSFVPTSGNSVKEFWREETIRKNFRLFIQEYFDEV